MAQQVGYRENNVEYTEGPFVIVNAGGWRIESELKGHQCPVLPGSDIIAFINKENGGVLKGSLEQMSKVCDKLNALVDVGEILLHRNWWSFKKTVELEKAEDKLEELRLAELRLT